jgi:hypothetical protein
VGEHTSKDHIFFQERPPIQQDIPRMIQPQKQKLFLKSWHHILKHGRDNASIPQLKELEHEDDKGWPDLLVSEAMVMMAADDCRG